MKTRNAGGEPSQTPEGEGVDAPDDAFLQAIGELGGPLLATLEILEGAFRHLHPPALPRLREAVAQRALRLDAGRAEFARVTPPEPLAALGDQLGRAAELASRAAHLFSDDAAESDGIARVLGAMSAHCRAQEALYPLRGALSPVSRYFAEPALRDAVESLEPTPPPGIAVGLHAARPGQRGGFCLYVPERYRGDADWPLVVALHGGSGCGDDFIWSWLREARSRRFLLLAPTSQGSTWSFNGPDVDAAALASMVGTVKERWRVDPERVLLTGLSDGATYSLTCGLRADMPFSALAPVSGVLHPANFSNGNLGRAAGKRIYLVHGALDWMFPIELARAAAEHLTQAGAELRFREIANLSHTYPREENARILEWFDPTLSLPSPDPAERS